jgi:chemotaxis protein CheD
MERVIGLGEIVVSNQIGDVLKTYALGSCIGITIYSSFRKVGGMGHIVLPRPLDFRSGNEKPGNFASTGVPFLINKICSEFGCHKSELKINLFGGASSRNKKDIFQIGKRNSDEVIRILQLLNFEHINTDIGGAFSRTIEMDILSGNVKVTKQSIRF